MLELRPNCEACDRDLPPDSPDARICTYECTFCADCVATLLLTVVALRLRFRAAPALPSVEEEFGMVEEIKVDEAPTAP